MNAEALRASVAAAIVRDSRLVVVLRRVEPIERLIVLVDELADAGARAFEITMDAPDASAGIRAARTRLDDRVDGPFAVGVGSAFVRGDATVQAAIMAAVRRGQEGSVGGS
jgi:2-keto-3-deoxy-6-phosphogluconate aldolase